MPKFDHYQPHLLSSEEIALHERGLHNLETELKKLPEPKRSQALTEFYRLAEELRTVHRKMLQQQQVELN